MIDDDDDVTQYRENVNDICTIVLDEKINVSYVDKDNDRELDEGEYFFLKSRTNGGFVEQGYEFIIRVDGNLVWSADVKWR